MNSGAGGTSLSGNAHGEARWLANWHPDCVLASCGLAVLPGRARWSSGPRWLRSRQGRGDSSTGGAGFVGATRDHLGRVMTTSTLKSCSVSGRSLSSTCKSRTNAVNAPSRPAGRRSFRPALRRGPLHSGPGGGGVRGVVGETTVPKVRLRALCVRYVAGTREVHGGYTTGAPSSYCSGRQSPVRCGVGARHESSAPGHVRGLEGSGADTLGPPM